MKKETKEALYSLLDLMDMLGSIEFINMDISKANSIRKEVLDVIGEKKEVTILDSNTEELLGILPMILLDVNKFPSAREIMNFAEKCLNIKIKSYWLKRSRAEAAGIVLNEVYEQSPEQFNKFLQAWSKFNGKPDMSDLDNKKVEDGKGFMEAWFEFFDSYKGAE